MSTQTGTSDPGRRWGLPHLALLVPWVAVVIGAFKTIRDNSFLWHIRAGHLQVEAGSVLTADPFSFTRGGEPWLTQSWLADVLYGWLHEPFGLAFTPWLILSLSLIPVVLAAALAYRFTRSVGATALLIFITSWLLVPVMVPRPVIFTFPLFLMVILAWEEPRLRWSLPFVFWLWASLHGSFFVGLLYIFLRWLALRDWRAWKFGVASGLATLITAHGMGTVTIVLTFLSVREELETMMEWQTPDFLNPGLAPFVVGVLVILIGAMRGFVHRSDFWVLVPFLVLALSANRGVLPAWLAILPIAAASLRGLEWRRGHGFPMPVAFGAGLVILLMPVAFARSAEIDSERFPVAAAGHLHDVRTFHDDGAGGYFIYALHFTEGVYIDDRVELYREGMLRFAEIRGGLTDWEPEFSNLGIEQALVSTNGPLHRLLRAAGWGEYYRDARYSVLRSGSRP